MLRRCRKRHRLGMILLQPQNTKIYSKVGGEALFNSHLGVLFRKMVPTYMLIC